MTGTAPADLPQRDLRIQFSDQVSISPSLVAWIETLTEPAFERRFGSAHQAIEALESKFYYMNVRNNSLLSYSPKAINQPENTCVDFIKTPFFLEIHRPLRGIEKVTDLLCAICLISALLLFLVIFILYPLETLFGGLLWICLPFIVSLEGFFGSTKVRFDRNNFEIKWQIFNLTYFRRKGATPHIQDFSLKYAVWGGRPIGITITSGSDLNRYVGYSFGAQLSEAEMLWLAQEIRGWLHS